MEGGTNAEQEEALAEYVDPPNLEELLIDESLPEINRIEQYAVSEIQLQKLYHINQISSVSKTCTLEELKDTYIPLLQKLIGDESSAVREVVLNQLSAVTESFVSLHRKQGAEAAGVAFVISTFYPMCVQGALDEKTEEAGVKALTTVSQYLPPSTVKPELMSIISDLFENNKGEGVEEENMRRLAVRIGSEVSLLLGPKICRTELMPIIVACMAESYRMRSDLCTHLCPVASLLGHKLAQQLILPIFIQLATDDVWAIRKSAAENITSISLSLPLRARRKQLCDIMTDLIEDVSKWVRSSAFSNLGKFIASLNNYKVDSGKSDERVTSLYVEEENENAEKGEEEKEEETESSSSDEEEEEEEDEEEEEEEEEEVEGPLIIDERLEQLPGCIFGKRKPPIEVPQNLLSHYISMIDNTVIEQNSANLILWCATALPAVLATVGKSKWNGGLKLVFDTLPISKTWLARRSVAYGLVEIARVLGPDITSTDLSRPLEVLFRDLNEVRIGVISNFAATLEQMHPEAREKFSSVLGDVFMEVENNWRLRSILARQLSQFYMLFSEATRVTVIEPLVVQCIRDKMSYVSHIALEEACKIIVGEKENINVKSVLCTTLLQLASEQSSIERSKYITLCSLLRPTLPLERPGSPLSLHPPANQKPNLKLALPVSLFRKYFLELLLNLKGDRVVNVRIKLSRLLWGIKTSDTDLCNDEDILSVIKELSNDSENDVVILASGGSEKVEQTMEDAYSVFSSRRDNKLEMMGRKGEGRCTSPPPPKPNLDDLKRIADMGVPNIGEAEEEDEDEEEEDNAEPVASQDPMENLSSRIAGMKGRMRVMQGRTRSNGSPETGRRRGWRGIGNADKESTENGTKETSPDSPTATLPKRGGHNVGGYPGHDGDPLEAGLRDMESLAKDLELTD